MVTTFRAVFPLAAQSPLPPAGEDDAAELPSVLIQRSSPRAEHHSLQPGEPVAAAGAAEEDREVVVDELAAATGEDGRTADQARSLLLAAAGREPSDAAVVCVDGAADCWAASARGVARL